MTTAAHLRLHEASDRPSAQTCSSKRIAYGVPFQMSANQADILASMLNYVPFGAEIAGAASPSGLLVSLEKVPGDSAFTLCIGEGAPVCDDHLQPLLERLGAELMVHVADHAVGRVFVHAGVVGWKGRALIFPGPSYAGKSTLIAALVRAGATYYSDEYAVLDERGVVYPYARDLQMREPGGTDQTSLSPLALTTKVGGEPLTVAQVIFASYRPDGRWQPEPLTAGMAVLEMLRHTIPVQRTPTRVMSTLAAMMQTATAVQSERGDARQTAEAILGGIAIEAGAA